MQPALWLRWPALLLSYAFSKLQEIIHILMVWMVSAGPIPSHIAFIMDGNRRFADRLHVERRIGHSRGYDALLRTLKDCFDLQVKTVTLFAFSIDNFQRPPDEVSALMDLMQTKLESLVEKKGLASEYGIQVRVLGDLSLLPHGARMAAEKAMAVTSQNSSAVLNLCISYTSTQEIVQSIQRTCDNVITALAGDDGSQGSVAMWKCKKGDTPAVGNGNVHAVWSHTARHGCVSNCVHTDMDGSMSYTCNGDYDCLNGSHKERDGGVSNGDGNCLNPYHSTEVVHGGYCQCKNCGYAYANSNCNGWDVDRLVDVNHGAYVCENGLSRICDEGANNSKPEVSSKEIMAVDASDSCNNIRTSQLSVDVAQGVVVQGGVAQSVGLRNRTHKKDVVSGNSSFQDPHSVSICDRDPKQSEGTFTGEDNGYVKKAETESRIGGFSIRELRCDSSNMDYDKCKTISQRCSSGLSDSDLSGKLRSQQYQFVNGTIRKDNDVTKEGFLSNCKCSKYCYLNDRIFKLVKDCISEEQIERHLYTEPCPPPDLLIRTSGETRLSNFLLWQTSFSHLAFCKVLWPEFSFRHLFFIILEYQRALPSLLRKRRYCNIAWKKNQ